jgi:nucleoside-diphosphate-sugar epimerase
MSLRRRGLLEGVVATAALAACSKGARPRSSAPQAAAPPPVVDAPATPKRILILGGTGFVGPAIVDAARARGHAVTLFNRARSNPTLFRDVETIVGDRLTGDVERLKGRDWDAVIDTWGPGPTLVRKALEVVRDRVGQCVFVSTISVYKLGRDPIDEGSPVLPLPPGVEIGKPIQDDRKAYGPLKALAEQEAEKAMPGRTTAVRSGVIVGPGDPTDRFIYWPLRLARGGTVLAPGAPTDPAQFIDVRDLAAWIIHAIERKIVGVYNTVGPSDPSFGASLTSMKGALGSDARFEWVPNEWLEANDAGGWGDFPLAVEANGDTAGFARVSAARAVARGLRFRPPGETAKDALAWWRTLPEERRARERPGATEAREAELLARWRARVGRR